MLHTALQQQHVAKGEANELCHTGTTKAASVHGLTWSDTNRATKTGSLKTEEATDKQWSKWRQWWSQTCRQGLNETGSSLIQQKSGGDKRGLAHTDQTEETSLIALSHCYQSCYKLDHKLEIDHKYHNVNHQNERGTRQFAHPQCQSQRCGGIIMTVDWIYIALF